MTAAKRRNRVGTSALSAGNGTSPVAPPRRTASPEISLEVSNVSISPTYIYHFAKAVMYSPGWQTDAFYQISRISLRGIRNWIKQISREISTNQCSAWSHHNSDSCISPDFINLTTFSVCGAVPLVYPSDYHRISDPRFRNLHDSTITWTN